MIERRASKAKTAIIIVLVLLILMFTSLSLHIRFSNKWEVKPYQTKILRMPKDCTEFVNRNELKELVEDLYGQPHFYREKENLKSFGRTIIILRTITIRKGLSNEDFTLTYAHELTHLKYLCDNETYTSYKTFVMLYESGNEILKNVAERYACKVIAGLWSGTDYDIGYYIQNYLNERSIKL